jgi:SAM-dependent methyltransferase
MNMSPEAESYSISDPLTIPELEHIYHELVLKQDFYGDSYGSEWTLGPYEEMAKMLADVIAPTKHVDVGCGKGFLVSAMRRLGIPSFGVEFSEALVKQVPDEVKPYIEMLKTEDWINGSFLTDVDLVTYMEVFEHLPLSISASTLRTLRDKFGGTLLITTPSYGIDDRWKLGIQSNSTTPSWQNDMAENIPFRQIVLKNGLPHLGHVTLCSYRWWTEFFLFNGWVRSLDLESRAAQGFGPVLAKHNWNPYILQPLPHNQTEIAIGTSSCLGAGWHEREELAGTGRWMDGHAQIYLTSDRPRMKSLQVELNATNINVVKDFNLTAVIEQLVQTPSFGLQWSAVYVTTPCRIEQRERRHSVELKLLNVAGSRLVKGIVSSVFRLTLFSPSYSPSDYGLSTDRRKLGLFIFKVFVES